MNVQPDKKREFSELDIGDYDIDALEAEGDLLLEGWSDEELLSQGLVDSDFFDEEPFNREPINIDVREVVAGITEWIEF